MRLTSFCGKLIAASAAVLFFAVPALAQDEDMGALTWGEDAKYVVTTVIKFKPGKRERAMEIIDEYYLPAVEKDGTAPPKLIVHMQTGHWDMAVIWDLAGGTADLEWYRSPDAVKWREALVEIAGSEEEAAKIQEEYGATIADSMANIGHYHTGME